MFINNQYPFEVLPLPYNPNAFEPYLDCHSIAIHHDILYRNYVNKLNSLLAPYEVLHNWSLDEILYHTNLLPIEVKDEIEFNGGGVYNHQVFFNSITPFHTEFISCPLRRAIESHYTSLNNFIKEFTKIALNLKGSGYIWIVCNEKGEVSIYTTTNQNTTIPLNLYPLVGIDMWEHAYYTNYISQKDYYLNVWFNLINWEYANNEYIECLKANTQEILNK